MGFYIRKSFKLQLLRFNLSRSGVGALAGVKRARVRIDRKGKKYIHAGRGEGLLRLNTGRPLRRGVETKPAPRNPASAWTTLVIIVAALFVLSRLSNL